MADARPKPERPDDVRPGPPAAISIDEILRRPPLAELAAAARREPEGWSFLLFKQLLHNELPAELVADVLGRFLSGLGPVVQGCGPIRHMQPVARQSASFYCTLIEAQRASLPGAPLAGGLRSPAYDANTREIFVAKLPDARSFGRSALRALGDALIVDHQGDEPDRYPTRAWFDPIIAAGAPGAVHYHLPADDSLRLPAAIDLTGVFTPGWGHILLEYAPQLLAIEAAGQTPPDVPILTDAGQPAAHLDALTFLSGSRRRVLNLPFRAAARVRELWVASAPEFWPALRAPGVSFRAEFSSINPVPLARLLDAGTPSGLPDGAEAPPGRRLFLGRAGQNQRMVNQATVAEAMADAGIVHVLPERHSFATQLRMVREATHVAGPWGSQLMLALLYGAPDLRVLIFHRPDLEERPGITAIAEARGQKVLVVPGEEVKTNPNLPHESTYRVPSEALAEALEEWL
jgi:hypothetical protein